MSKRSQVKKPQSTLQAGSGPPQSLRGTGSNTMPDLLKNLTYQQVLGLIPQIYTPDPTVLSFLQHVEANDSIQKTGLVCLLLAEYKNYQHEIDAAEAYIWQAFNTDTRLLSRMLPPENPNHQAVMDAAYDLEAIRSCPVCASQERTSIKAGLTVTHPLYHRGLSPVIHWVQCIECGHVYARKQNGIAAFANGPARTSPHMFNIEPSHYTVDMESVYHLAAAKPEARVLELGPGAGTRMTAMRDLGLAVYGIELREKVVEHCRKLGLNVLQADFFAHQPDVLYDVIVLGDVIEHITESNRVIAKCVSLLNPAGLLWISTPIFDGFILEQKRRTGVDPYFSQVEHVHYFTRNSLLQLATRFGFKLVQQRLSKFYLGSMEFTFELER